MPKPRQPTPEEIQLFRRAAGEVRPLVDDRAHHAPPRRSARARPAPTPPPQPRLPEAPELPDLRGDHLDYVRPGVQRKVTRRLRRGQLRVEESLDLHGMTVAEAHRALERFLAEAHARGLRCVHVVHGKGFGSPGGRPTLKGSVDRWLRLHRDVLGFTSATAADGGTGAVYVLLRAARE